MGGTPHGSGGFFILTLAHTVGIASLVPIAGNGVRRLALSSRPAGKISSVSRWTLAPPVETAEAFRE